MKKIDTIIVDGVQYDVCFNGGHDNLNIIFVESFGRDIQFAVVYPEFGVDHVTCSESIAKKLCDYAVNNTERWQQILEQSRKIEDDWAQGMESWLD